MADNDQNEALEGAHTLVDPARAAKVGDARATAEAAMNDLVNQIHGEETADQLDLLEDEPCLFAGPVTHVAETLEQSRGAGRPKGSRNKANQLFRDTLLKMGFQHPGINLAALANADPVKLAAELSCKKVEAMALIKSANAELMPYFESKRPTEVLVEERRMGVLVIENTGATQQAEGVMSLTGVIAESEDISDT